MSGVVAAKPLNQDLHRLAEQFAATVTEQGLDLIIDQHDPTVFIDDHGRVGSRVQEPAESIFGTSRSAPRSRPLFGSATQILLAPSESSPRPPPVIESLSG